jgi:hypothetical protein
LHNVHHRVPIKGGTTWHTRLGRQFADIASVLIKTGFAPGEVI